MGKNRGTKNKNKNKILFSKKPKGIKTKRNKKKAIL
jgi:hypothetical protein